MPRRFIIMHPERGVFVGHAMGMFFWSKWDAAGQMTAATWESLDDLKQAASQMPDFDGLLGFPVETKDEYATVPELLASGVPVQLLGELLATVHYSGHA